MLKQSQILPDLHYLKADLHVHRLSLFVFLISEKENFIWDVTIDFDYFVNNWLDRHTGRDFLGMPWGGFWKLNQ